MDDGGAVMKPDNDYWTREAIRARQIAFLERHGVKLEPEPATKPPTPQEKAQKAFAPSLEAMVKANAQSNRKALERTQAELEEAERERDRAEYARRAQIANFQAIELGYAQQQAEALAARRYDPTGNWGPANYRSGSDE
jgi:hypothetical protein